METIGIAADTDHFAEMSATLYGEVKGAEQAAYAVVGHEFNLGSPKQLQEVLFTELGLPKTKKIKTGYTTDSDALTNLLVSTGHPVLEHIMHHRDVSKLKSFVDILSLATGDDGRIHTTFNQMVAATGRLSSTDPNLQNIPIRTELGRRIREGFVVGPGYETLLTADYSQIECASWPTSRATRRCWPRSNRATTSTPRPRPACSAWSPWTSTRSSGRRSRR